MPNEIHPFLKNLCMCVYVYNMYVLFFKMSDNLREFGSMTSEINVSELSLEETALEVYLSLLI